MISGILMTAQALLGHAVVGAASDKSWARLESGIEVPSTSADFQAW